jgi:hypothetical protein
MTLAPAWSRAAAQADQNRCVAAHAQAQMEQRSGALLAAREQLLICAQKGCPKPIAADCTGWLAEDEQSLPSVVFAVSDDQGRDLVDVRVTANGAQVADKIDGRALPIDPGLYQLRFEAEGYEPGEQAVTVRQAEKNRIVRMQLQHGAAHKPLVTMDAASLYTADDSSRPAATTSSASKTIPVTSYVLGGVAVVGLGMFTYFGLTELSDVKEKERLDAANALRRDKMEPEEPCGSLCDRGKRDFVLTYVGLGVAVAGAAGAVLAYVLSEPQPAERADRLHLDLAALPQRRAALLQLRGAF